MELGMDEGRVQPELGGLFIGGTSVSNSVVVGGRVESDEAMLGVVSGMLLVDAMGESNGVVGSDGVVESDGVVRSNGVLVESYGVEGSDGVVESDRVVESDGMEDSDGVEE